MSKEKFKKIIIEIVGTEHMLYGSDYPFTPDYGISMLQDAFDHTDLLNAQQLQINIDRT